MTKAQLRADLLARRRAMSDEARAEAADAMALHLLAAPVLSGAKRVACYLSMASEPGTGPLIAGLLSRGTEVIVPISLSEGTLDWVVYDGTAPLGRTALGIAEPAGERLGSGAIAPCALVVVPALAVDHAGYRLGRGAGYYDRALAGTDRPLCALVHTHELVPEVPHEPHDVPVGLVVTPAGLFRVP